MSGSGGNYSIRGSHIYRTDIVGTMTVEVSERDDAATSASGSVAVTVAEAPLTNFTLTAPVATEGTLFDNGLVATFTDPNTLSVTGDFTATITWGDDHTSAGTLSGSGGHFDIRGSHTYDNILTGTFRVTVAETDDTDVSASGTAAVTVAGATLTLGTPSLPVAQTTEGSLASGVVATFSDPYLAEDALAFAATITWGDGQTSTGTVSGTHGIFTISGNHSYQDVATTMTVAVAEIGAPSTLTSKTGSILVVEAPIAVTSLAALTGISAGQSTGPVTVATFVDGNRFSQPSQFTAVIDWGDNSTSLGTVSWVASGKNTTFSVTSSHVYRDDAQTLTVTIAEADDATASASLSRSINIAEGKLTLAMPAMPTGLTEGNDTGTITVATFGDSNLAAQPGDFVATISWGDGQTSAGTIGLIGVGTQSSFSILGRHAYVDDATAVSVTLKETRGSVQPSMSTAKSISVIEAGLTLNMGSMPTGKKEGDTVTFTAASPLATITDTNTYETASNFSATVLWENGQQDDTAHGLTITGSNGSFQIFASHTYHDDSAAVTVTVFENDGTGYASKSASLPVSEVGVTLANLPAITGLIEGASTSPTVAVATFTCTNVQETASDFTATINWGDGMTTAGTITRGVNTTFTVTSSHSYTTAATNTLSVTIADNGGPSSGSASKSRAVTVAEAPLYLTVAPAGTTEGSSAVVQIATFTDGNAGPTAATTGSFVATISWGDTTTSLGTIVSGTSPTFTITGGHLYTNNKTYPTPTVTVLLTETIAPTISASKTASLVVSDAAFTTWTWSNPVTTAKTEGTYSIATNVTLLTFSAGTGVTGMAAADYTATVTWGDGTTGAATVSGAGNVFTLKPTVAHTYVAGATACTITVKEKTGTNVGTSPVRLINVNSVSIQGLAELASTKPGGTTAISEGDMYSGAFATFTCTGNTRELPSNFIATVSWGDGLTSDNASGVTVTGTNGVYTISGSHRYVDDATSMTINVSEINVKTSATTTTSLSLSPSINVGTRAWANYDVKPLSATQWAEPSTVVLATFSDLNTAELASNFTATIDWGDNSSTSVGTVNGSNGNFTVTGSHTYATYLANGTYSVTVVEANNTTGSQSKTASLTVVEAPISLTVAPAATEGIAATGVVATFTVGNSEAPASHFTATITWGDGSTPTVVTGTSGGITSSNGIFTVRGSHAYSDEMSATVTVTVSGEGQSATTSHSLTVADAPLTMGTITAPVGFSAGLPVPLTEGQTASLTVATFTDANPLATPGEFAATITWGDGHTSDTSSGVTITQSNGSFSISGSHTYTDMTVGAFGVSVKDIGGGESASGSASVTVADAALTMPPAAGAAGSGSQWYDRRVRRLFRGAGHVHRR